jgi:hypothetical protein
MRAFTVPLLFVLILLGYALAGEQASTAAQSKIVRGWLSDEQCASGRASEGVFTGTSPRCAKECVAKGRKIVLVDPDAKRLVKIENQSAARSQVGDYVEIKGTLGSAANLMHIDSLKLLAPGVAACARPKLKE